jgi:hypothetical protein
MGRTLPIAAAILGLAGLAAASSRAAEPLRVGAGGAIAAPPFEVEGGSGPTTQPLFALEAPPVAAASYQIAGTVAYEGVEGSGYLEMWSVFPDGSRYFSRALDRAGPMAALAGRSDPRPFALPFFLQEGGPRPVRLEVNVVLPAGGRVRVSDLRFASPLETRAPGAWWSPEQGGLLGAVAGTVLGLVGAAVGTLCSLGVARPLVEALLRALAFAGLASLAGAALALASGQPYEVWYPLALTGGLATLLSPAILRVARRRYAAAALSSTAGT